METREFAEDGGTGSAFLPFFTSLFSFTKSATVPRI